MFSRTIAASPSMHTTATWGSSAKLSVTHPLLSERWRRVNAEEFGGVWLYDVTERFGREWAKELLNSTGENPVELLESIIIDEMEKW